MGNFDNSDNEIIIKRLEQLTERERERETIVFSKLNSGLISFSILLTGVFTIFSVKFSKATQFPLSMNSSFLFLMITWLAYTIIFMYVYFQSISLKKTLRTTLSDLLNYRSNSTFKRALILCLLFDYYVLFKTNELITIRYTLGEKLSYQPPVDIS